MGHAHPAGVRGLGTMASTHMQQSMQEAAAESVRRLWDRSREEADEGGPGPAKKVPGSPEGKLLKDTLKTLENRL